MSINIVFFLTPNYKKKKNQVNVIYKQIDLLDQFVMAYKSIKKNWKHDKYYINLFHNKDYKFSDEDHAKLSKLDITIIPCEPDHPNIPYLCRCSALTYELPNKCTHRLILDCDVIALNEPIFDLSCDWQAMYAGGVQLSKKNFDYINQKYNYNIDLGRYKITTLFRSYLENPLEYDNLFPHFNAGAFLVREELCVPFVNSYQKSYELAFDEIEEVRHIGVQYAQSFALIKLSSNWKPFEPGVNYLGKCYDINKFGKNNIKLLHYCGINGENIVYNHFSEYLKAIEDDENA